MKRGLGVKCEGRRLVITRMNGVSFKNIFVCVMIDMRTHTILEVDDGIFMEIILKKQHVI